MKTSISSTDRQTVTDRDTMTDYTLVIEANKGDQWEGIPVIVRLRRLVKSLARGYGFRLVAIRETGDTVKHGK